MWKKVFIAIFRPFIWLWEFIPQTNKYGPFWENPTFTKIISITASVNEKNAKYSTKHDFVHTLDAGSNKNIKDIEILLKRNWNFPKHIFNKNIEKNI